MPDQQHSPTPDIKRGRRPEKTYSKHVRLTEYGRAQIEAWALEHELNFSAAIETLALMSLDDPRSAVIIPALREATLQGIRLTFNRLARLLSDMAIEAAVARTTSEAVMLQIIRQAAAADPQHFEQLLVVRRDGRLATDARVRKFHDELKVRIEEDAIRRLQTTLSRAELLFNGENEKEDDA